MNTEQDVKSQALGREIMRLLGISRGPVESILDEALSGRERTTESLLQLYNFVVRNFGLSSTVTSRFWGAVGPRLRDAGLTEKRLREIEHPYPLAGEPNFKSVLDEMAEEGGH